MLASTGEAVWLAAHVGGADWPPVFVRAMLLALVGVPIGAVLYAFGRPADVRAAFAATLGLLMAAAVLWLGPRLLQRDILEGNALGFPHYAMLTIFALTLGFILAVDAAWVLKRFSARALYVVSGLGLAALVLLHVGLEPMRQAEEGPSAVESPSPNSSP